MRIETEEKVLSMLGEIFNKVMEIDAKVNKLDERMDRLEERMDRLEERMERLEERMDRLEERMDRLEERVDKLEKRVDRLEVMIKEQNKKIDNVEMSLREAMDKHVEEIYFVLRSEMKTIYDVAIANKNLITRFVIQVDKMTILFRDEVAKIDNIRGRIEALEMISQNHTEVFRELFGIEPKEVDMLGKVCEPTTQYNV